MDVRNAYNNWAAQYDINQNKTRDLEAVAIRVMLESIPFDTCLEIGCGTGKNTEWLQTRAASLTAVDFSEEMLRKAKEKLNAATTEFIQADITQHWDFVKQAYHLVTFSLVLEHIEDLNAIFRKAASALAPGGYLYVGELHPFKQYTDSKARFETAEGIQVLTCYLHHLSDFMQAAAQAGFRIENVQEYFDEDDRTTMPRILALLFRKV
ncbi:class I SAM-dependent DNA methyltransferase [Pontibacter arcticus]|uniref:SAM-dependent methyltransferase n=1 Tax=Pontibacter arcticus TaxID=2080288 RepID=A0A364RDU4_9BACT|nr:class I SAM-dependent methyltransferase [Pontibacter arcticus]RAU82463.1 SAM-dependent methyltransferase [Pontibacter arcticus]